MAAMSSSIFTLCHPRNEFVTSSPKQPSSLGHAGIISRCNAFRSPKSHCLVLKIEA